MLYIPLPFVCSHCQKEEKSTQSKHAEINKVQPGDLTIGNQITKVEKSNNSKDCESGDKIFRIAIETAAVVTSAMEASASKAATVKTAAAKMMSTAVESAPVMSASCHFYYPPSRINYKAWGRFVNDI